MLDKTSKHKYQTGICKRNYWYHSAARLMSHQLWIALILSRTSQIETKNKSACKHKRQKATKHPLRSSYGFFSQYNAIIINYS